MRWVTIPFHTNMMKNSIKHGTHIYTEVILYVYSPHIYTTKYLFYCCFSSSSINVLNNIPGTGWLRHLVACIYYSKYNLFSLYRVLQNCIVMVVKYRLWENKKYIFYIEKSSHFSLLHSFTVLNIPLFAF